MLLYEDFTFVCIRYYIFNTGWPEFGMTIKKVSYIDLIPFVSAYEHKRFICSTNKYQNIFFTFEMSNIVCKCL